ncbi:MAG TPA: SIS domain-containing protein, partial [Patescibacteria group bacterium]|nr:SIS domain-containing protein [Patescibacteria group bacterium]
MSKINLDNLEEIKKLDAQNMLGSLELLSKQVEQVWDTAQKIKVPADYKKVKNLVTLGMGGSALGSHIIKSVFVDTLKMPVEIVGGYHVPEYVGKDSLVLLSSYSGTTEEVLFSMKEAKARGAKLLAMTAGGELADWALANKIPSLIFTTENNPSNQ